MTSNGWGKIEQSNPRCHRRDTHIHLSTEKHGAFLSYATLAGYVNKLGICSPWLIVRSPLYLLGEKPACVALGKLHSPRLPPKERTSKAVLNVFFLENPERVTISQNWFDGTLLLQIYTTCRKTACKKQCGIKAMYSTCLYGSCHKEWLLMGDTSLSRNYFACLNGIVPQSITTAVSPQGLCLCFLLVRQNKGFDALNWGGGNSSSIFRIQKWYWLHLVENKKTWLKTNVQFL